MSMKVLLTMMEGMENLSISAADGVCRVQSNHTFSNFLSSIFHSPLPHNNGRRNRNLVSDDASKAFLSV